MLASPEIRNPGHVRHALLDEHGGVLVLVAFFAPVAILFVSFVLDVGNSFVHARHLQTQADAAVFAAAQEFPTVLGNCNAAANTAIAKRAGQYGGATELATPFGTATSGSLYILGPGHAQYAIRVFGETAKVRILRFDVRSGRWLPQ